MDFFLTLQENFPSSPPTGQKLVVCPRRFPEDIWKMDRKCECQRKAVNLFPNRITSSTENLKKQVSSVLYLWKFASLIEDGMHHVANHLLSRFNSFTAVGPKDTTADSVFEVTFADYEKYLPFIYSTKQ